MRKIAFVLTLFLAISTTANGQEKAIVRYYCPPCGCEADELHKTFQQSGNCPYCGMRLLKKQNDDTIDISYQKLLEFEGKYEYLRGSTLTMVASPFDTTLYAVIDQAKYPLTYVSDDTFTNIQDVPVVFGRDNQGKIDNYTVDGQSFERITTDIEKLEMFPRRELFDHPENYLYRPPEKANDGLDVGNLEHAFENPELIQKMVRETIVGAHPDVHSILIYKDHKLVLEEYFY